MSRVEMLLIILLVCNTAWFMQLRDMINTNKRMKGYYDNVMRELDLIDESITEMGEKNGTV